MTIRHFQHARSLRAIALALSVVVIASASSPSAQTVGVSLVPTAQRIDGSNELPFKTDWLFGGRLALQFGKYVALQPFYFTRDGYGMDSAKVAQRVGQVRTRDLQPYAGFGLRDGDAQIILGARADLGPINPGSGLHFVPELAVGFGSGPFSVLALANAQYAFGAMGGNRSIRPYVTLGGGVYSPTVLGINTAIGSSFRLQSNAVRPLFMNVELQSINLGGQTRLLFGLSRSQ